MAPLEPSQVHSNIGAYIGVSLSFSSIALLFFLVARTLVQAHRALPIAYRTRAHDAQRRAGTWTFAALALLSFAINVYTFQEMIVNSYRNWAFENKQVYPVDVWSTPVWYPRPKSTDLQLARWMQENDLKDCVQIMAGSWRDFWWQQQHAMGTAVWSIFLAIEGRRRNIPYTWALLPIAHFVGLSVAQNLFYLALLFTPVPLSTKSFAGGILGGFAPIQALSTKMFGDINSRPHTWVPKPIVYIAPLVLSVLCTSMLRWGIGTAFQDILLSAPQMLCYLTLFVTNTAVLPASWGTDHRSIHAAHASTTPVFRTAAVLAFLLYAGSTTLAILSNTPPARRSLYDILPFTDNDSKFSLSNLDRYRLAIARIIGALSDHPVVQKLGWDVLLSGFSLCVWTGIRGLDARNMLSAVGFPVASASKAKRATKSAKAASVRTAKSAKDKAVSALSTATEVATSSPAAQKQSRKTGAAKKALAEPSNPTDDLDREETPPVTRSHNPASKPKASRSRSKSKSTENARPISPLDSSSSSFEHVEAPSDAEEYRSMARGAARTAEHEDDRGAADVAEGTESAALAWGFCVLGGLGVGMAGMAGSEAA